MPSTGWASITETATAHWLGRIGYLEAAALQHALVEARKKDEVPDTFLFLEHPPVITLGRASHAENVLAPFDVLKGRGIEVWETTRGGDVTYHGPGQLVGYPIVDLNPDRRDVHRYVRDLEEVMIRVSADYGLEAGRVKGFSGAWIGDEKIGAIGVRISRWITSHGFAFNVTTDVDFFNLIVPCGIADKGVTSLTSKLGRAPEMREVEDRFVTHFAAVFDRKPQDEGRALRKGERQE